MFNVLPIASATFPVTTFNPVNNMTLDDLKEKSSFNTIINRGLYTIINCNIIHLV